MSFHGTVPVSVIIISWNSEGFIPEMAQSLLNQTVTPKEIIVVDNGSTDSSRELLKAFFSESVGIFFPENRGFAEAANGGIEKSTQPYLFLLNTDIILQTDYLEKIFEQITTVPFAGAVMGVLINSRTSLVDSCGLHIDVLKKQPSDIFHNSSVQHLDALEPLSLIWGVNAAAVLYRKTMLDSIELEGDCFDRTYFSYFEDVDLSWRARNLGWRFYCVKNARALHYRGGSGALKDTIIFRQSYKNRLYLFLKNVNREKKYLLTPLHVCLEVYRTVVKPLFQPRLLPAISHFIRDIPLALYKRKIEKNRSAYPLCPVTQSSDEIYRESQAFRSDESTGVSEADIAIIIVNFNTSDLLSRCLDSLIETSPSTDYKIIVIDNASKDDSVRMVKQEFPHVRLLALKENRGFSAAVNEGLSACNAAFYLLLNSDTVATPSLPSQMKGWLIEHPLAGIVSPLLKNEDGSIQLSWGDKPTLQNEFRQKQLHQQYSAKNASTIDRVHLQYSRTRDVDWVTGACLMIRKTVIDAIGPMDENFFMYFEDIDWCLRTKKAGWRVYFTPEMNVIHTGGASAAGHAQNAARYYRNSQKLFYKKHYSFFSQCGLWLYFTYRGNSLYNVEKFSKVQNNN